MFKINTKHKKTRITSFAEIKSFFHLDISFAKLEMNLSIFCLYFLLSWYLEHTSSSIDRVDIPQWYTPCILKMNYLNNASPTLISPLVLLWGSAEEVKSQELLRARKGARDQDPLAKSGYGNIMAIISPGHWTPLPGHGLLGGLEKHRSLLGVTASSALFLHC